MDIVRVVGIGIIATLLAVIVRRSTGPEFGIFISLATGVIILSLVMDKLVYVVDTLNYLVKKTNLEFTYFSTILKIIGIAYLVEFGAQISRDAGEEAIGSKIELGGKIIMMVLAVPILLGLMELIIKILP